MTDTAEQLVEKRSHAAHNPGERKPRVRGRTISIKRYATKTLRWETIEANKILAELDVQRPKIRADCLEGGSNAERPCPFVSCKFHLFLDVSERSGAIKINFPGLEIWEMNETCVVETSSEPAGPL